MNLKIEEILMVVIAFLIGYFLSNMISGSSLVEGTSVKAVGGKHESSNCPQNKDDNQLKFMQNLCSKWLYGDYNLEAYNARSVMEQCYGVGEDILHNCNSLSYNPKNIPTDKVINLFLGG